MRPTATTSRPGVSSSRNGCAASISARVGRRFDDGVPGCVGTTFQSRTSSATPSSSSTRWTIVAEASAGPAPVSCRSDVNGMPLTRAPRYPAASPTSTTVAFARERRYAVSRSRRSSDAAYWLYVAPIRARASASTSSIRASLPRWVACRPCRRSGHFFFARSTARSSSAFDIFDRPSTFRRVACLYSCSRVRLLVERLPVERLLVDVLRRVVFAPPLEDDVRDADRLDELFELDPFAPLPLAPLGDEPDDARRVPPELCPPELCRPEPR